MAKRFIDTEMFNDEWVCSLSKDCKLFFIYYITTCDHAGVLRLNKKLCEFQTGLKTIETLIKELDNCLVTVKDGVYFMPKFIHFQYPQFPQSKVKQQEGAISILKNLGFWNQETNSYLTVSKELSKTYVSESVNVDIINDEKIYYHRQFKHLKMTFDEYNKLIDMGYVKSQIENVLDSIENYKKNTNYTSLYLTAVKWLKKEYPTVSNIDKCPYTEIQIREVKAIRASGFAYPEWFDRKWEELI